MVVVLNDNEWSIDKNVGAIAGYLHRIVTNPKYDYLHERAAKIVEKVGGKSALLMARKAEEAAKSMLWPSVIFEELGLKYYGPIDGHDISTLIKTFEFLKTQERPVLLHVLTQKGKGFEPALLKQKQFHGLGPYDPETGETKPLGHRTYSEVFADTLVKLASMNEKVVAITAAMPNGTALDRFRPQHPRRYFDVGIAEEHAVLFAAGLAAFQALLRHLFDVFAARLRSRGARRLLAESSGCVLHGSGRSFRGRRSHPSWPVRYQLPAFDSEPGAHGSEG
jgi:1-deoxy-D-xylulose-5-phosphate synthase